MIKFIRKKHVKEHEDGVIKIYYSISDVLLGTVLMILVLFFINHYISTTVGRYTLEDMILINQAAGLGVNQAGISQ